MTGHRVVTVAGHVDHGKSTLLHALTGMRIDRLPAEQQRGLTIDLVFVWTELPGTTENPSAEHVAFIDVPGHERFLTTMIAGAGPASGAILVVAADSGFSAQSREHLMILDLLAVRGLAVVITKAGRVDPQRIAAVESETSQATVCTTFSAAPSVVVDSISGLGLDALRAVLRDRLATTPGPAEIGFGRLWIDRVFTAGGSGTVVTGTLLDGPLRPGIEAHIMPAGRRVRIRRLQSLGEEVHEALTGSRVAVNVVGVSREAVGRGDTLVAGPMPNRTALIDVHLRTSEDRLTDGRGVWRLHVGTTSIACTLRPIDREIAGEGPARLTLAAPVALRSGDRFVLRDPGRSWTAAGGVVVDTMPPRVRGAAQRRRHADAVALAARAASPDERIATLVRLTGGWRSIESLRSMVGTDRILITESAHLTVIGDAVLDDDTAAAWSAAVARLGPGVHTRDQVREVVRSAGASDGVAAVFADYLVSRGTLMRTSFGFALSEEAETAASASEARAAHVLDALRRSPFAPPPLAVCLAEADLGHRERTALLASGPIVKCGSVHFTADAIEAAISLLSALEARTGPSTAAAARDALGTSRRFAVPILEHLSEAGITRFDGNRHAFDR